MNGQNTTNHAARTLVAAGIAAALTAGAWAADSPRTYSVQTLGPATYIEDMNDSGTIIGWWAAVPTVNNPSPGNAGAFVIGANSSFEMLPVPEGFDTAQAMAINNTGLIVGYVLKSGEGSLPKAVLWTPNRFNKYDVQLLLQLPEHDGSMATVINDDRQILGVASQSSTGDVVAVWFNSPESVMDLSPLGVDSTPKDLSNRGVLLLVNGDRFDLNKMQKMYTPPVTGPIGTFGALAINDFNEITGVRTMPNGDTLAMCLTRYGVWEFMGGVCENDVAAAYDVNKNGVIVLETTFPGEYDFTPAVRYPDAGTYPIIELLAQGQPGNWWFDTARGAAINDNGQIALIAYYPTTGGSQIVLLSPVTNPGDADVNGIVNHLDLMIVVDNWGTCGNRSKGDFDDSGTIDLSDLIAVLEHWH